MFLRHCTVIKERLSKKKNFLVPFVDDMIIEDEKPPYRMLIRGCKPFKNFLFTMDKSEVYG